MAVRRPAALAVWRRPVVLLGVVALVHAVLPILVLGRHWFIGIDESVYLSQINAHVPAGGFSAPRARGSTLVAAPVTAFTDAVVPMRVWTAALSGLGLFLAFRTWLRLRPGYLAPVAAALFASLWTVTYYGFQVMPNEWVAFATVGGCGSLLSYPAGRATVVARRRRARGRGGGAVPPLGRGVRPRRLRPDLPAVPHGVARAASPPSPCWPRVRGRGGGVGSRGPRQLPREPAPPARGRGRAGRQRAALDRRRPDAHPGRAAAVPPAVPHQQQPGLLAVVARRRRCSSPSPWSRLRRAADPIVLRRAAGARARAGRAVRAHRALRRAPLPAPGLRRARDPGRRRGSSRLLRQGQHRPQPQPARRRPHRSPSSPTPPSNSTSSPPASNPRASRRSARSSSSAARAARGRDDRALPGSRRERGHRAAGLPPAVQQCAARQRRPARRPAPRRARRLAAQHPTVHRLGLPLADAARRLPRPVRRLVSTRTALPGSRTVP